MFPHHGPSTLRPSFNDEKSAPGCLGIFLLLFSSFSLLFILGLFSFWWWWWCLYVEGGCLCTHPAQLFFLPLIFCSQALNLMSWDSLCRFFIPHLRLQLHMYPVWLHLEPQLTTGSITKLLQGEGEIWGRSHFLKKKGQKDKIVLFENKTSSCLPEIIFI